jgi:hypothetical protein
MTTNNHPKLIQTSVISDGTFATVWLSNSVYKIISGHSGRTITHYEIEADRLQEYLTGIGVKYSISGHLYNTEVIELALGTIGRIQWVCHLSGNFIVEWSDGSRSSIHPLHCYPAK